jgi:hypothetical protein
VEDSFREHPAEDPLPKRFHQENPEGVYNLYNACNGKIKNGLLDIAELERLTDEERKLLNVVTLYEAWQHVAAGCSECERIIETLNYARRMMRERIGVS